MTLDIHIGAHKTATTFIQQTLRKNVDALEDVGTRFLSPREFRYMHEENWNDGDVKEIHNISKAYPEDTKYALDPSRKLLLSDENLLGGPVPFYHANTLYPELQKRLTMAKKLLPCLPDNIYLCIRNYQYFYPAVYYQFASQANFLPINEMLQDRLIAKPRRWPQIVEDVQAVFPTSVIKIWLYEDFAENRDAVLNLLTPGAELKFDQNARPRQTPKGAAYDAWVKAKDLPDGDPNIKHRFTKWLNKSGFVPPENDVSFAERFWRDKDVEALVAQYSEDVGVLMECGLVMDLGSLDA